MYINHFKKDPIMGSLTVGNVDGNNQRKKGTTRHLSRADRKAFESQMATKLPNIDQNDLEQDRVKPVEPKRLSRADRKHLAKQLLVNPPNVDQDELDSDSDRFRPGDTGRLHASMLR